MNEQLIWTQEEFLDATKKIYDLQNRTGRPYFHTSEHHKEAWCSGSYGKVTVDLEIVANLQCELTAALAENSKQAEQIKTLKAKLERYEANVRIADCCICGSSVWNNQQKITDKNGTYHPICKVAADKDKLTKEIESLKTKNKPCPDCGYYPGERNGNVKQ